MTVDTLKDCNKKHLAQMAKDQGIVGWHAMRKDQLIRALAVAPAAPKKGTKAPAPAPPARRPSLSAGSGPGSALSPAQAPPPRPLAILPPRSLDHACVKDRIIAM